MKFAIVYFSLTGHTEAMAHEIARGLTAACPDAVVDFIPIADFEANRADYTARIEAADGVIVGTPVYCASEAWQVKQWLDTCGVRLAGKLGGAYSTAHFIQGGVDTAIERVLMQLIVKGMVVYSGGAACGQPFIHLGPVAIGFDADAMDGAALFPIFGERFARKAQELFGAK